jgi:phosphohistidine phosphatase SixA
MKSTGLVGKQVRIASSEHKRTMASAAVLADELGAPGVEEVEWLTDGNEADSYAELKDYAEVYDGKTVVIAVTHLPEIEKILESLSDDDYNVDVDDDIGYSDTYIIDTAKRTVRKMEILP